MLYFSDETNKLPPSTPVGQAVWYAAHWFPTMKDYQDIFVAFLFSGGEPPHDPSGVFPCFPGKGPPGPPWCRSHRPLASQEEILQVPWSI